MLDFLLIYTQPILRIIHFSLAFMFFGVIYYLGFFHSQIIRNLNLTEKKNLITKIGYKYYGWLKWEGIFTVISGLILYGWIWYPFTTIPTIAYLSAIFTGFLITTAILVLIWIKIIPLHKKIENLSLAVTEINQEKQNKEIVQLMLLARRYTEVFNYLGIFIIILMVLAKYL